MIITEEGQTKNKKGRVGPSKGACEAMRVLEGQEVDSGSSLTNREV